MHREQLKSYLQELIFKNGRARKLATIKFSDELLANIHSETANCKSIRLKDRLYWILNDILDYKICLECNKEINQEVKDFSSVFASLKYCCLKCRMSSPIFHQQRQQSLLEKTGYSSPLKNPTVLNKLKNTNLAKYGCENVFQSEDVKTKIKKTSLERYGIEVPSATDATKALRKQTMLARYGVENPSFSPVSNAKRKATFLKRYSVENASQVEEFKAKARATNLDRYGSEYPSHTEKGILTSIKKYGVRHPMQNFKVFQKVMRARFKIKHYTTLSGKIFNYQGYEDVAIKFLLEKFHVDEALIVTDKPTIPKIFYLNPITNKMSRYYPDIWVTSMNLFIEVKSIFTFKQLPEVTLKKQAECKKQGFNHIILICSKTKILEIV